MGKWENGRMGECENGKMGEWENGKMGECENVEMGKWENGRMGKWENGRMMQNGRECSINSFSHYLISTFLHPDGYRGHTFHHTFFSSFGNKSA